MAVRKQAKPKIETKSVEACPRTFAKFAEEVHIPSWLLGMATPPMAFFAVVAVGLILRLFIWASTIPFPPPAPPVNQTQIWYGNGGSGSTLNVAPNSMNQFEPLSPHSELEQPVVPPVSFGGIGGGGHVARAPDSTVNIKENTVYGASSPLLGNITNGLTAWTTADDTLCLYNGSGSVIAVWLRCDDSH
jgi:hypothetical protein